MLILDDSQTTNAHKDVGGAINCCAWAEPHKDGSPGGSVWDLWTPGADEAINAHLHAHHPTKVDATFAMHQQQVYLGPADQDALAAQGIKWFRIHQHAGESILFSVDVCHQVSVSRSSRQRRAQRAP